MDSPLALGPESVIVRNEDTGMEVRVPAFPDPVIYVRIVDEAEEELVYWHFDEWSEGPEQAQEVMGAIMGAIKEVFEGKWSDLKPAKPVEDRVHDPEV